MMKMHENNKIIMQSVENQKCINLNSIYTEIIINSSEKYEVKKFDNSDFTIMFEIKNKPLYTFHGNFNSIEHL